MNIQLLICLTMFFGMQATEKGERLKSSDYLKIDASSLRAAHSLGKITLFHNDKKGFYVSQDDDTVHKIKNCWMDAPLRNVSNKQLKSFQENGYFILNQMSDGEFSLRAHARGLGSGPITGMILYWTTKSLCYGAALAGATTLTVGTGGLAPAVASAAGSVAITATASSAVVGAIAPVAAAAMGPIAAEAAIGTVAVVANAGGIAGAVAAVESASMGAFALGTAIPFLP